MKSKVPIILMVAVTCVIASAQASAKTPAELKGARFVFDSDRDLASDKVISVYVWEDGRTKKIFKGAICPRWSSDGERIACVLSAPKKEGRIGILERSGNMKREILPSEKAQAVEWLDENNLIYVAQVQGEADLRKTALIKYDLSTSGETRLYTTRESGGIYQMNWNRGHDGLILDIGDRFPGEQEFKRRAALLNVKTGGIPKIVYEGAAYKPALFHDDETLVFQADMDTEGKPARKAKDGALAVCNFRTRKWAGVRDASLIQNTRFSRDGNYFYSAEGEGEKAVVIRLFSTADLDKPLLRVSPQKEEPSWPHKDLRPDLFIPASALVAMVLPAPAFWEKITKKTVTQQVVGEEAPASGRHARPQLPARLNWRPDPNLPAPERRLPVEREPVAARRLPMDRTPSLPLSTPAEPQPVSPGSTPSYTVTPMAEDSLPYTVTPMAESSPAEGQSTITGMPSSPNTSLTTEPTATQMIPSVNASLNKETTITHTPSKPLTTTPKMTSGTNQPLNKLSTITSDADRPYVTSNDARAMAPPAWFKVPSDATPIERGWYYTTELGDRFTTQYSSDWSSYTATEEGPNFNSKTTYPVSGAKQKLRQ